MADTSTMTPLARALSHHKLDQHDPADATPSPAPLQPCRRRRVSCKSLDTSDTLEARVLVINTGGTIGMTIHDDGSYDPMLLMMLLCLLGCGS